MARSGPPPRFTDETWLAGFLALVGVGMPPYLAAEAQGVSRHTYFLWARLGGHPDFTESADWVPPDEADPEYREFVKGVLSVEAVCLSKVLEPVYVKSKTDPDFGLKFLRHKWPELFNPNRNATTTVVVQDTPNVQVSMSDFKRMQRGDDDDD